MTQAETLTPTEREELAAHVKEHGLRETCETLGMTRHSVTVLLTPMDPREGTIALYRSRRHRLHSEAA